MVMSRIENEHGCTLSRIAEKMTRGRRTLPLAEMLHNTDEKPEADFKRATKSIAKARAPKIINTLFITELLLP